MRIKIQMFLAMFFACILVTGCGVEGETSEADFIVQVRMEEAAETSEQTLCDDAGDEDSAAVEAEGDDDAACEWVTAVVCVGNVCVTTQARLCGGKLFVNLPVDTSLIGLTITATVPGVGTFTGTYQ